VIDEMVLAIQAEPDMEGAIVISGAGAFLKIQLCDWDLA